MAICCKFLDVFNSLPPFDTLIVFLNELFEKANFEKKSPYDNKSIKNYPAYKELSLEKNLKLSSGANFGVNFNTH